MAVTDEAMAALRAYLAARTKDGSKDAERGFLTPSRTDHLDAPASLPGPPTAGRSSLTSSGRSWGPGDVGGPAGVLPATANRVRNRGISHPARGPGDPERHRGVGPRVVPDGSKLAVDVDSGGWPQARLMEIMTYTLATGAFRSWTASGVTNPVAPFGFTGSGVDGAQSISWTADSRTLAFSVASTSYIGVRLLDTAAGGTDLMADSRLAVTEQKFSDPGRRLRNAAPPYYFVSCITAAMISMDGSAIVCGYSTSIGNTTTMGFAHYSTVTGKMNHVAGLVHFKGKAPTGISLYWVNSTGKIAIGTSETTRGGRVGVMNGDTFTPLPGVTGSKAIAW